MTTLQRNGYRRRGRLRSRARRRGWLGGSPWRSSGSSFPDAPEAKIAWTSFAPSSITPGKAEAFTADATIESNVVALIRISPRSPATSSTSWCSRRQQRSP